MSSPQGQLFWFDLLTTDVAAATKFYTELFGWTVTAIDSGGSEPYQALLYKGRPLGGVVSMSAEAGIESHWKAYMRCDAVDATADAAVDLGGEVLVPPTDLPGVGRYAAIGDPFGGYFSPLELLSDEESADGPFVWHELRAPDFAVAWAFYSTLFPWDEAPVVERPDGTPGQLIRQDGIDVGVVLPHEGLGHWVHHVAVSDLEAAIARAEALGGRCIEGESALPSVRPDAPPLGHTALLQGPTGALFGVCSLDESSGQ